MNIFGSLAWLNVGPYFETVSKISPSGLGRILQQVMQTA